MTSLSDTLTVGLVLVLLFGSIALYLYTRIQQAEQKISLLESILLDLKMSSEIKSYTELPADDMGQDKPMSSTNGSHLSYTYFSNSDDDDLYPGATIGYTKSGNSTPSVKSEVDDTVDVDQYKSIIADAVQEVKDETPDQNVSKVSVNYESMTLKELQSFAKTRGITGANSMKKGAIIEALKTSDRSESATVEPGSSGSGLTSFLETSSPFSESETN